MLGIGSTASTYEASLVTQAETGYKSLVGNSGGPAFDTNYTTDAPFNSDYTISFWLKMTDGRITNHAGTSYRCYFTLGGTNDVNTSSGHNMGFLLTNLGLPVIIGSENGDGVTVLGQGASAADGANDWTHWVITVIDGGAGGNTAFQMYKDGTALTSHYFANSNPTNHAALTNYHGLRLGVNHDGQTGSPKTKEGMRDDEWMDDFAVHDAALDADAVTAMYNSGTPINLLADSGDYDNSGNVVLYYKFNGAYDDGAVADSHGTSNAILGSFSTESAT